MPQSDKSNAALRYFPLFERVYALLDDVTPRRFDCGRLCGARCCKNLCAKDSFSESGMALLPYEKEYLQSIGAKGFTYHTGDDGDILLCGGNCKRAYRPFACRIFPYYAHLDGQKIKLRADIRAASVCPLVTTNISRRAAPRFLRNAQRAAYILASEPVLRADLQKNSDFIASLYELYARLNP